MTRDVLVAGAGPAGLATALACALRGYAVTVVDASPVRQPGAAAVETLHPQALAMLRVLGALDCAHDAAAGEVHSIRTGKGTHALGSANQEPAVHVDKERFVQALRRRGLAHRVRYVEARVTAIQADAGAATFTLKNGDVLRARWGVLATGARRLPAEAATARYLSPPLTAWTGVLAEGAHPSAGTTFTATAGGWTWWTPTRAGSVTWTALALSHDAERGHVRDLQRKSEAASVRAFDARWRLARPLVTDCTLRVGDAAGRLDPAWGQGITSALHGALDAADTIHACDADPGLSGWQLAVYDQRFVERFEAAARTLAAHYASLQIGVLGPHAH